MCGGEWCGGGCGAPNCFGNLMYMFEKLAACCAMTAVTSCIVITVMVSIGLGVGIGYNYSFIDQKTYLLEGDDKFKGEKGENNANVQSLKEDRLPEHTTQWATTPRNKPGWSRLKAENEPKKDAPSNLSKFDAAKANLGPPEIPTELRPPKAPRNDDSPKIPKGDESPKSPSDLGPPKIPETKDEKPNDYDDITATKKVDVLKHDYDDIDGPVTEKAEKVLITEDPQRRKAKYKSRLPASRRKYKKNKPMSSPMPTLLIPLQGSHNLSPLLSKILSQKKNVTLQFITI